MTNYRMAIKSAIRMRSGALPRLLVLASPATTGQVNTRFTEFNGAAEGGTLPYRYELVGEWPEGLSIHPLTGRVWGTPTEAGTFSDLRVKATDARGRTGQSTPIAIKVLPAAVPSLDPNAASQAITNAYGMRKIVPTYSGIVGNGRNNATTLANIGFDADGIASQAQIQASIDAAGSGGFTWGQINDQKGTAHFTSTSRPATTLNGIVNRAGKGVPGLNYTSKAQNMVTTQIPLSFAGKHVAVFIVARTQGWSSAGAHARNPAVFSNASGPLLGYGTAAGAGLIYGAYGSAGETHWRPGTGNYYLESGTPDDSRVRNLWYRWSDGKLSGGIDTRLIFADRPCPSPGDGPFRLVLGSDGNVAQSHNGQIYELITFVTDEPLSLEECMGISMWQRDFYGDLAAAFRPYRGRFTSVGQSLMQYFGTIASYSGGGNDPATFADQRVIRPGILANINPGNDPSISLTTTFNSSAIGGSSLLAPRAMTPDGPGGTSWNAYDGVTADEKFWWDQYANIPGPCAVAWLNNGRFSGSAYDWVLLPYDLSQSDAITMNSGESDGHTVEIYKAAGASLFAWLRAQIGQDRCPIVIQPLGRQTGVDAGMRKLRKVQQEWAAEIPNVFLGTEMCDISRQDTVHPAAGPADPNGFDLAGARLARIASYFFGDLTEVWRGPEIVRARLVNSTTIDVEIVYPEGCGGTDFGPAIGIVGFSVTGKTVTSAARLDAHTIRLTGSGFAPGDLVQHNPIPAALDRTKMVVDNFTTPMPLRQAWDVPAAA